MKIFTNYMRKRMTHFHLNFIKTELSASLEDCPAIKYTKEQNSRKQKRG